MTLSQENRFGIIETRLTTIERDITLIRIDIAAIKTRLDALPTRWMFWAFFVAMLVPLYGLVLGMLYFVLRTAGSGTP